MRQRGFTLVEMIVVVVIVGLLAGLIVPQLTGTADARHLREESRRLLVVARFARDYAVTHRTPVRLVLDPAQNRYSVLAAGVDERGATVFRPLPRGEVKVRDLSRGLRFGRVRIDAAAPGPQFAPTAAVAGEADDSASVTGGGAVTFSPTGAADAAIIELTNGTSTWSLMVIPSTGRCEVVPDHVEQLPNDRIDLDA